MKKATVCPHCDKPGGALTAKLCCKNPSCSWNRCQCGAIYSRRTGKGFNGSTFYPSPVKNPSADPG